MKHVRWLVSAVKPFVCLCDILVFKLGAEQYQQNTSDGMECLKIGLEFLNVIPELWQEWESFVTLANFSLVYLNWLSPDRLLAQGRKAAVELGSSQSPAESYRQVNVRAHAPFLRKSWAEIEPKRQKHKISLRPHSEAPQNWQQNSHRSLDQP